VLSGRVFGHAHTSRRSSRCKRQKHSYSHIFGGLATLTSSIPPALSPLLAATNHFWLEACSSHLVRFSLEL